MFWNEQHGKTSKVVFHLKIEFCCYNFTVIQQGNTAKFKTNCGKVAFKRIYLQKNKTEFNWAKTVHLHESDFKTMGPYVRFSQTFEVQFSFSIAKRFL